MAERRVLFECLRSCRDELKYIKCIVLLYCSAIVLFVCMTERKFVIEYKSEWFVGGTCSDH